MRFHRLAILLLLAPLSALALADALRFNIPAQPLPEALRAFADQAKMQLLYSPEAISNGKSNAVIGDFDKRVALEMLLKGTGYEVVFSKGNAATVRKAILRTAQPPSPASADGAGSKKSSQDSFRLAQADQTVPGASSAVEKESGLQPPQKEPVRLEEVVVTAEKRAERLQDVPVPVTAVNADALVETNQLRLQDFYTSVPGLSVAPNVQSTQNLSIRGISTGIVSNPTVGIIVDDVPYGASTGTGGGLVVPDIDPGDLARIEVLRGPQGTFYGASSMGGLLKFVTVDPSTSGFSGQVQAGTSDVYNGAELGYNFRGSVNVPLSDVFAIRASAFTREDPGYIDNPILHIDGINEARVSGGRLSALWRPTDTLSLKLSALYQETQGDGLGDIDRSNSGYSLQGLEQNYVRGVGPYDRKVQAYSATLNAKLGLFDLTSVSGFNVNEFSDSFDYTYALQAYGLSQGFFGGDTGSPVLEHNKTHKFTQEVRLSAPLTAQLDWVLGGFYTRETSQFVEDVVASNALTGAIAGVGLDTSYPTSYREYAAFTDFTFHFTDRFDVQIGGRESKISQTSTQTETGPYVPVFNMGASPPFIIPEVETKANAFTYLATPRFKVSPDLMVYARLASGYRAGGPNLSPGGVVPGEYKPDKTENYEIGAKGDFFDHLLTLDTSLYYIDWSDIQLHSVNPQTQFGYLFNGSRAKSEGLEVSLESRPLTGLTVSAWLVFSEAELTENFPTNTTVTGMTGDRIPYTSRFSGNFSIQQDFPLGNSVTGFVGGALSYVGEREGEFLAAAAGVPVARQVYPAYAKTDLRSGVRFDSWTINLFVNNLTDRRGVLSGGLGATPPFGFTYIQPRTVGIGVALKF